MTKAQQEQAAIAALSAGCSYSYSKFDTNKMFFHFDTKNACCHTDSLQTALEYINR